MTPTQQTEIIRRAKQDAVARLSGWPVSCPYSNVDEIVLWRKEFEAALEESKK
jgi:hypothetical protein